MNYSPAKLILLFFMAVILLGTGLLSLPFARTDAGSLSLLTNAFTATSSVCVTGLLVVDISTYYTFFGQLIILALIQLGGFGYMALSTMLGVFIGKISLAGRGIIKEVLDVSSFAGLLHLLKKIIALVLLFEGIGAVILTAFFMRQYPFWKALYYGVFHSVSAFCNAGISLFSNNLEGYASHWGILLTVGMLIIIGGIGFLVLVEGWGFLRKKTTKLSVHSKLVIGMTVLLILAGTLGFLFLEKGNVLSGKSTGDAVLNSCFHSITARTAGFNVVSIALCRPVTAILLITLMFIGASPGGTGGGIKTSTFAVTAAFIVAILYQRETVNIYKKRISVELLNKAIAVFVLSIMLVVIVTTLLMEIETHSSLDLLFETVSAFGTVGLSRNVTPTLSNIGQALIMVTMVIGRIGVLTFLMALIEARGTPELIKYPEEKVLIG